MKLQVGSKITCPACSELRVVPSEGVKDLPNNFFINRILDEIALKKKLGGDEDVKCDSCVRDDPGIVICVDCGVFLCNHCHESHKYSREYQGHHMMMLEEIRSEKIEVNIQPKAKLMLCKEHDAELNFYCDTCEKLVCSYCTMKQHARHNHDSVVRMAKKCRSEVNRNMGLVDKCIDAIDNTRRKISPITISIESQAAKIKQEIDIYYDQLQQQLQQERDYLQKELHEVSRQKKIAIILQLEQMKSMKGKLEKAKELGETVNSGSDREVLFIRQQLNKDFDSILIPEYNRLDAKPVELANMEFVKQYNEGSLPHFGTMFYGKNSPFNTAIAFGIPPYQPVGKEVKFTVITKGQAHSHCAYSKRGDTIAISANPHTGVIMRGDVEDNSTGGYTFQAHVKANQTGKVKLGVTVNGEHIKGSPYSVQVRQYSALDKVNKIVDDGRRMGNLVGIAFNKDGVWAVADYSNHCVCIFDRHDQLIRKFGSPGNDNGQFNNPCGLAFDAINHLHVVELYNHRVQKFDINGGYILQFGKHGSGDGELSHPSGITAYNDRVYVAESDNHRISVFHCDGQFIGTIGSGQLSSPQDVAVTNNNQVLVADYGHHCISIFTFDGNYVGKIAIPTAEKNQLVWPTSITVDLHDYIFITEWGNHRVSVFNRDGVFVHYFECYGSGKGSSSSPLRIACSPNGSIYVSDHDSKRIQIFSDY